MDESQKCVFWSLLDGSSGEMTGNKVPRVMQQRSLVTGHRGAPKYNIVPNQTFTIMAE